MAKKKTSNRFNGSKYDRQHLKNMTAYQKQVEDELDEAVMEAARIGASIADRFDEDELFSFDRQSPFIQRQANALFERIQLSLTAIITNGIAAEWGLSVDKNNEMSAEWLLQNGTTRGAYEAFLQRVENGLGLSDKIWQYTGQFKDELELSLSLGIKEGVSAARLSRELRRYMKNPNMLFRRVRNKYGQLVLSQRAAAYHPGQGVYRSSYQNAMRLAGTETNIAYHTADYEQYNAEPFVVGIEVKLSNNHNCKGVPKGTFEDICDELAGEYPKDFKFTGWHPNCRCYTTAILKTDEEFEEDALRVRNGEQPLPPDTSVNYVGELPRGFRDWVLDNQDKIESAKSLPYFVRDNQAMVDDIINGQ